MIHAAIVLALALPWADNCQSFLAWTREHYDPRNTLAQKHIFHCNSSRTNQTISFASCLRSDKSSYHVVNIKPSWWTEYRRLCSAPPSPVIFRSGFETGDLSEWGQ
jgi:hypothetical protein